MADMKEQLTQLYKLQEVDSKILLKERTLTDLDDGSATAQQLKARQEKLAAAEERVKELSSRMRDRELSLKSAEEERDMRRKQAFSGTVTDSRQLAALQKKVEELTRNAGKLEEEILELMELLEPAQLSVRKLQKTVSVLQHQYDETVAAWKTDCARFEAEIADLQSQHAELASGIEDPLLKQYQALLVKKDGIAVAAVKSGSCSACKVAIPMQSAQRLIAGNEIVLCDDCRRLLYLPAGETAFRTLEP